MTLIETLIVGVGAGVAKGVLKLWLKEDSISSGAASEVVDIIRSKTSDVWAQKAAQRQFDRISEKAAENILRLINSESSSISSERQLVVAIAAGQTVKSTPFSVALLIDNDMDPESLTGVFLSRSGAEGGNPGISFNEDEQQLYRRILSESAQSIIDLAIQLPLFTEHTITEVLKRESAIQEAVDSVLSEVRRIQSSLKTDVSSESSFESDLRRAIVRRFDELQLFGVDTSLATKKYRLSVAYVSLSIQQRSTERAQEVTGTKDNIDDSSSSDTLELLDVEQALSIANRILIRGHAGSGKTTLMQWIAIQSAGRSFKGALADWNDCIPFIVKLREFSREEMPAPEELPSLISKALAGEMPEGWVHRKLRNGNVALLVDGLDEITNKQREAVRHWLADILSSYGDIKICITSRPHAVDRKWLGQNNFLDTELQAMSLKDIDAFVSHWHDAIVDGLQSEEEKEEARKLESNILEKIRTNRAVLKLATSPLLCALLCALHRDRVMHLPNDRIELYRACIDMFLRRDVERQVDLEEYPSIGDRQKRVLLQDFAYWLIRNGWSEVSSNNADERFGRTLESLVAIPPRVQGPDIRRLFVERSGILREPKTGRVDFPHRTFQEYLAAQAALDEGDIGELAKNSDNDQWREVLILAAGLATPDQAEKLISEIVERGDNDSSKRHRLHLLAVACLETIVQYKANTELRQIVRKRLATIVPPKKMGDARDLAAAGDLVVPHLRYSVYYTANVAAACLRTLALVGTEAAISALGPYCNDNRRTVVTAFFNSLRLPELTGDVREQLLDKFFENQINATSLDLSGCGIVLLPPNILKLSELTHLRLRSNQISDIPPAIAGLQKLQTLVLWANKLTKLPSELSDLTKLRHLDLDSNLLSSLPSEIGKLGSLTILDLRSNLFVKVPDEIAVLKWPSPGLCTSLNKRIWG